MGREVRMVPAYWEHPKNARGNHKPLHDGWAKRKEELAQWERGFVSDYRGGWKKRYGHDLTMSAEDYFGKSDPADFMPEWTPEQCTHLQMYETCSEGTPISPVMATPEDLARWLADNGASAFGEMTASYEGWLSTCKRGHAPSMMFAVGGPMVSGVEALKSTLPNGKAEE